MKSCYLFFIVSGGEIPPKKLQALQKVLQSEFCNAIREVCNSKTDWWIRRIKLAWLCPYQTLQWL